MQKFEPFERRGINGNFDSSVSVFANQSQSNCGIVYNLLQHSPFYYNLFQKSDNGKKDSASWGFLCGTRFYDSGTYFSAYCTTDFRSAGDGKWNAWFYRYCRAFSNWISVAFYPAGNIKK